MILEGIFWRMLRVSFCRLKIDENVVIYNKMIGNFCVVIVIIYLDNRSNLQFMYEKWIETVVIWNFTSNLFKVGDILYTFSFNMDKYLYFYWYFSSEIVVRDLRGYLVKNIFKHFLSTKLIYEIQSYMIRILICWFSTD